MSEEYSWNKLWREYFVYCCVGCINVAFFFILYHILYNAEISQEFQAAAAWSISYFISSILAHYLHRWLTFESISAYRKSLFVMLSIYIVLLIISTASTAYFADTIGINHYYSWAANTVAFGFIAFVLLRLFAFPISDGRISRQERLSEFRNRRRA